MQAIDFLVLFLFAFLLSLFFGGGVFFFFLFFSVSFPFSIFQIFFSWFPSFFSFICFFPFFILLFSCIVLVFFPFLPFIFCSVVVFPPCFSSYLPFFLPSFLPFFLLGVCFVCAKIWGFLRSLGIHCKASKPCRNVCSSNQIHQSDYPLLWSHLRYVWYGGGWGENLRHGEGFSHPWKIPLSSCTPAGNQCRHLVLLAVDYGFGTCNCDCPPSFTKRDCNHLCKGYCKNGGVCKLSKYPVCLVVVFFVVLLLTSDIVTFNQFILIPVVYGTMFFRGHSIPLNLNRLHILQSFTVWRDQQFRSFRTTLIFSIIILLLVLSRSLKLIWTSTVQVVLIHVQSLQVFLPKQFTLIWPSWLTGR